MTSGGGGCPLQVRYEKLGKGGQAPYEKCGGEGVVHFRPDMKMGGGGEEGGLWADHKHHKP